MSTINITGRFYDMTKNNPTRDHQEAFRALDSDQVAIIAENGTAWIELSRINDVSDSAYETLIRLIKTSGYKYLYE